MSRACMLHPENQCHQDADGKCVCAPPGTDPAAWAALTNEERRAKLDCPIVCNLAAWFRMPDVGYRPSGKGRR
jgi:hypothetical protein